jgi:hypothetical protein
MDGPVAVSVLLQAATPRVSEMAARTAKLRIVGSLLNKKLHATVYCPTASVRGRDCACVVCAGGRHRRGQENGHGSPLTGVVRRRFTAGDAGHDRTAALA